MRRGSVTLYDASPWLWLLLAVAALAVIFLGGEVISGISSTVSTYGEGPTVVIKKSQLEKMAKAQAGEVLVYYPDAAMESVAAQIAEELARSYAFVKERLGWELKPVGVVLLGGERPGTVRIEMGLDMEPPFSLWLPSETIAGGLAQAPEEVLTSIYWVMPHEATEPLFSRRLYANDCGTRWVGDGLAEYAGYIVSGEFSPAVQQAWLKRRLRSIERLLEQGKTSYNLPQEFQAFRRVQILFIRLGCQESPLPVMVAGYGVSFAVWLDLVDRHGEEVLRKFWPELQKIQKPRNQDVFKLLKALTGEDVEALITRVELPWAAEVLRRYLAAGGL
ncbi:MAG: hypothetical protein RML48_05225 [Candidatus Bipolaricaulota bacterium]|nr:hypothetical protein [Candidatus Bipolaricaulota bacterium]